MTPDDARRRFNSIRRLHAHIRGPKLTYNPGSVLQVDDLELQLLAAMARDAGPGPQPDGFPSGVKGSGGEYAARSTTEAATLASYRLDKNVNPEHAHGQWVATPDPHHQLTTKAAEALRTIDEALNTLLRTLELIRHNGREPARSSNPGGDCLACDRHVEGTANDRIRRGMCSACYTAWGRDGKPDLAAFRAARKDEAA